MKQNRIISALMRGSNRDRESTTKAAANPASWSLTPSSGAVPYGTCGNVIMRSGANQKSPPSDEVVANFDKVLSAQELNSVRRKEDNARPRTPTAISSRYESKSRGIDRYADSIEKRANSPKGIDEFDMEDIGETTEHCNPAMVNATDFSCRPPHVGDACTDMSSSLFEFVNDTQTEQSSSSLDEEASSIYVSGFSTNYVEDLTAYGSSTPKGIAGSATSYLFELADDGNKKQRRKTQSGIGQNPKSFSRPKVLLQDSATRQSTKEKSTSRRVPARELQCHRRKNSNADSELANHDDLIQISEEISGLYLDAKSAFEQVLYAFFISPDDIDQISDTLSNAKIELVKMCHDQRKNKN